MSYTLAYTGAEIDALLGKIDAIFVAEYGSTIYSEVTAAIAAGNKVIVANAGKVYVYAGQDDNGGYVFTQSGPNAAKPNATYVTLSTGNVWSTATVDLATLQQFYASLMEDTASGSIASFPDGAENVPVKELTADIEPIQDLHGQASPYPENGGKNKLPLTVDGIKALNTSGTWSGNVYSASGTLKMTILTDNANNVIGINVTGTPTINTFFNIANLAHDNIPDNFILNGCPAGGVAYSTYQISLNATPGATTEAVDTGSGVTVAKTSFPNDMAAIIRIGANYAANNLLFKPMIRLSTEADATFAPYSNICPISGYTGAEITRDGKNLYQGTNATTSLVIYGGRDNGSLVVAEDWRLKAGTYTLSFDYATAPSTLPSLYISIKQNGVWSQSSRGTVKTATFTLPEGYEDLEIWIYGSGYGSIINKQIELGSAATAYEAYNGTVYSVSWSDHGTVYKGTAEYKGDGEWEITKIPDSVDMGTLAWVAVTSAQNTFYAPIYNLAAPAKRNGFVICDRYASSTATFTTLPDKAISANADQFSTSAYVFVHDSAYSDAATFKTAVTGAQLVYELATPVTFTVSGPDPETLLGDNNIWSNTGDISVKYRCNTALYIEKKLGA